MSAQSNTEIEFLTSGWFCAVNGEPIAVRYIVTVANFCAVTPHEFRFSLVRDR